MNLRPAAALTTLALAVATAGLAGCSGGSGDQAAAAPQLTPIAVAQQDTTPLNPSDYRVAFEGALSGNVEKTFPAKCETDGEYDLTLTGKLNGSSTVVEISNLSYKTPGQVQLRDSGITADIAQSDVRKDWRNQGSQDGDGSVTYNQDGRTGSFDITVPEISYDTAAVLPNNSKLHLVGRWSCGTGGSES